MSVKELTEAMGKGSIYFGIRQAMRHAKKAKVVFLTRDARNTTVSKLETAGIEFVVLKSKADMAKELNLDFESEVFLIK